jgi:uncharacterized protein YbjT (DUF2867 family)
MSTIAVTGASGAVGSAVARRLAEVGVAARLLVRDPARAPRVAGAEVVQAGFDHVPRLVAALRGIDTVFMVSIVDGGDRLLAQQDFVDAAVQAGVRHVVYLSFVGADEHHRTVYFREHGATEAYLRDSGLDVTIVRSNYYVEHLVHFHHDGAIRGPVGDGRLAPVARDDVAAAVAAILTAPHEHVGQLYELTGPESLTFADVATLFEKVTGEPCGFVDQTDEQARAERAHYGAPDDTLETWLAMYVAVRHGVHAHVTDDVRHLTGREPTPVLDALFAAAS